MTTRPVEEIARDELKNKASSEEALWLRSEEGVPLWKEALIVFKRELEHQFAARKSELTTYQQACWARGGAGKKDYFKEKALHDEWRNQANFYKTLVEQRIMEAKKFLHEYTQNKHDEDTQRQDNPMVRVAVALERIADVLERKE
ncbi:MAG: hypothetical protein CMK74_14700 [Pseudomonadales bacterium]|nr:hypothetical protein [Pseudomonadales bacterium]|tara:strand:- start:1973 stop:2407 length:435 start_codon:yes stop_codon:yes gene_type:complete